MKHLKPEHFAAEFHRALATLQARVHKLQRKAELVPEGEHATASAMEELSSAMEELSVAEEELTVQGAELLLSRAATEAAERRYRELFELAPDGYVVTDRNAVIQEANFRASELLGIAAPRLAGKPLAAYVALEYRREFRRLLLSLLHGERVHASEVCLQPRKAEPFPAELTVAPVTDDAGALQGWRWLLRDVSERKRLERETIESADRERRLIGQELHDDLGQRLTGVLLLADGLRHDLQAKRSEAYATRAGRVAGLLGDALKSMRALAHRLAAVSVPPEHLAAALAELADTTRMTTGVHVEVRTSGEGLVEDATKATHLYRIAQEAVTNAIRHAAPHTILIQLSTGKQEGVLRVANDGFPFLALTGEEGLGLHSMRLRAGYIGASLDVQPQPKGGTVVECCFKV